MKTLANWRSLGTGPTYKKVGGRVVYEQTVVMDFGVESSGLGNSEPHVTVTVRPYPRDPKRSQVDIMITHPGTDQTIRKRLTAPAGLDADAARRWGEGQVQEILRELFSAAARPVEEDKPTKHKTTEPRERKAPTFAKLWDEFSANLPEKESQRRAQMQLWEVLRPIVEGVRCDAWGRRQDSMILARFRNTSPGYLTSAMVVLRSLLRIALADGYITHLPTLPYKKAKRRTPGIAHGPEELARLLDAARVRGDEVGENLELLLLLGVDGGLRPGEVAGLRWGDIDWSTNQIIVRNQRPLPGDSDCLPKTGEEGRITMPRRLRHALEEAKEAAVSSYVITNKKGQPLYTQIVSDRVNLLHRRAGLDPKRAHWLRHCAASRVFKGSGGSVSAAQAHLRHKHASTTERYLHDVMGTNAAHQAAAILDAEEKAHEVADFGNKLATSGNSPQHPARLH